MMENIRQVADISTHSLTRRLTGEIQRSDRNDCISTHSLTRRLTRALGTLSAGLVFQLTASQGG